MIEHTTRHQGTYDIVVALTITLPLLESLSFLIVKMRQLGALLVI